jgi:hypothetical protein
MDTDREEEKPQKESLYVDWEDQPLNFS